MWAESTHISVKKKNLQKIDIKRTYFNIINPYMTKPQQTLCSMMKNWKIKKKTRMSTFTTIIQHNFGSLSPTNKKERKIEEIQMEKEIKLSLFTDDMILCIENPEDVTRKLLELINDFSKVAWYKANTQKSLLFLYTNNEKSEIEIKETISFTTATKRIQYLGITKRIKYPGVKWKSESELAYSCPTLCDPMDYSLRGSSIHGIFQARVLEWIAISFSRGSSQPRDWTWVFHITGRCFTIWATME